MSNKLILSLLVLAGAVPSLAQAQGKAASESKQTASDAKPVAFPTGYRTWAHVKSMVIFDKKHPLYDAFSGIHHVYVNGKALHALQAKKEDYPAGSVFAFDLLEASESNGAYTEGKRKFIAVITRDAKKYADTEGWGWQAWDEGDPKKPMLKGLNDQKVCASCHKEVSAKGFVFSEWRP